MPDPVSIKERLLIHEAKRWVGVTEVGGNNRGQLVEIFQKAVDGIACGEPWCMAFAQYCISAVDRTFAAGFGEPDACTRSIIHRSEHCLTVWNNSKELRLEKPRPGALCIWQMYQGGKATSAGHVGVVVDVNNDGTVLTVEGNTSRGNGFKREGDGVWQKQRRYLDDSAESMRVKGFLRVW
jgi:hypothetical protein